MPYLGWALFAADVQIGFRGGSATNGAAPTPSIYSHISRRQALTAKSLFAHAEPARFVTLHTVTPEITPVVPSPLLQIKHLDPIS